MTKGKSVELQRSFGMESGWFHVAFIDWFSPQLPLWMDGRQDIGSLGSMKLLDHRVKVSCKTQWGLH